MRRIYLGGVEGTKALKQSENRGILKRQITGSVFPFSETSIPQQLFMDANSSAMTGCSEGSMRQLLQPKTKLRQTDSVISLFEVAEGQGIFQNNTSRCGRRKF